MPKNLDPKVSIICAVWNDEIHFEEHLKSLVSQTYKNKEIIIVDDGSTDNTNFIAKKFVKKYNFIKYYFIRHFEGYGCVRPRLEAIKHATGEVFCIVDSDGFYGKKNIEYGIKKLFSSEDIAAIVPRMHSWNPKNFISKYRTMVYESRFLNTKFMNQEISKGKYSPWLLKRKVYDSVGGYDIKDAYCEDLKLASKIIAKWYRIVYESKCDWYHDVGVSTSAVINKNFYIGKMHSSERNWSLWNWMKVFYFSLFFIIIVLTFFNWLFIFLILLHSLPMFFNGFFTFLKVRKNKLKWNAFYSPLASYLINLPYTFGFYWGLISGYKK